MRCETHSWELWQQVAGDPATEASASTGWTANAVLTLVFAALSVLVAGIGAWLANQRARASEETAREALDDARQARKEAVELALWTNAIDAVNRFMGFDPAREPVGTRLVDLRVRMMLLVDHFVDWEGFDEWLAEEHGLGAAFGRQAMEQYDPLEGDDAMVARVGPSASWAAALSSNLRYLRRHGYKPKHLAYLRDHAHDVRASLYEAHGWGEMPTKVPGLEMLGDDMFADEA